MTDWFDPSGAPSEGSDGDSGIIRSQFLAIQTDISNKLPALTGNANMMVAVNGSGSGLTSITSSAAKTFLGLDIGTDVQAHNDGLDDIAALSIADGNFMVGDGANWVAESGATARASLGVVIGTNVQAFDEELQAIAGLTSAANKIPYFTGSETAGLLDFLDEDNMASNSATALASQQSIRAYVDASGTSTEAVQDITGAMFTGNTETGITATYQDGDGTIDLVVGGLTTTQFSSANISQWSNDSGYLTSVSGLTTSNFASPNISQWSNNSGYLSSVNLATNVTGTLPAANGGTGTTALNTIEITQFNVTVSTSDPSGTPADGQLWLKREA